MEAMKIEDAKNNIEVFSQKKKKKQSLALAFSGEDTIENNFFSGYLIWPIHRWDVFLSCPFSMGFAYWLLFWEKKNLFLSVFSTYTPNFFVV